MSSTPIRRQYLRIKQQHPDAIVFFRLGDFYETFDQDAETTARELEIVLTAREMGKGQRVPMAGIPYHALDSYLGRLIGKGFKVALCEQLTPPGKGLVERDVVRVVTPGTVLEPALLDGKANNYLACVLLDGERGALAYADITTGEFAVTQAASGRILAEMERLRPSEVVFPRQAGNPLSTLQATLTPLDDVWFDLETARETALQHFGAATLEGYGCAGLPLAVRAAGAMLYYLQQTQRSALPLLTSLSTYSCEGHMLLDAQTQRNLELFAGPPRAGSGGPAGSLLSVIDLTQTPMGGRMLRRRLGQPLLDCAELERRQEAVQVFFGDGIRRGRVQSILKQVSDLERLINRVVGGCAMPRELVALRRSLELVPALQEALGDGAAPWPGLAPCPDAAALIAQAIADEPGPNPAEGNVVRAGFSPELDELRGAAKNARQYLANLEKQERERSGIKSLKVGYNKVFGYYIEVSKANLERVPQDYIRKQTLLEAERFFTPELKEYESLILNAQERMGELEAQIFRQVCAQVGACRERVLATGAAVAGLDVSVALAEAAVRYSYVRPQLAATGEITIKEGRHPVVERSLPEGAFVPNDTSLGGKDVQVAILTGPNMAGKSTYLRQVALIVLLAQVGSFVPAASAEIGLVDRIFTRIGAGEDLSAGRSTFMVEMVETASILNNATARSLIILDEIGRGTSTYDGLSIARAVVEYIHNHPRLGSKTLFATHYHELVELARYLPRVKNFNVAVAEEHGEVVFLRKIVPGGVDKSYGIHVAQLAGLPRPVVQRARSVLAELEQDGGRPTRGKKEKAPASLQLPLLGAKPALADDILKLDIDSLSPLEALTTLYELQKKARQG